MGFWQQVDSFFKDSATARESSPFRKFILLLLFFILNTALLSADILPDKVSLSVGQVSDRDVTAPRTVSFVDEARTKMLEAEVLSNVANVYDLDMGAVGRAEEDAGRIFRSARMIVSDKSLEAAPLSEKITRLKGLLQGTGPEQTIALLPTFSVTELGQLEEQAKALLRKYLQRGIRDEELDNVRKLAVMDIEQLKLPKNAESVLVGIVQTLLQPNFVLNVNETDKRRQTALRSIEPVRITVKSGQVIVRRGDMVSPDQMQVMMELGLHSGQTANIGRILGLAIYVLLVMVSLLLYLHKFSPAIFADDRRLVLIGMVVLVTIAIGRVSHLYSDFVAPVAVGPLLTAILVGPRIALMLGMLTALFFGVITDQDMRVISFVLLGSSIGIYAVVKNYQAYSLVRAGLWIAAVNVLTILCTGLIEQINVRDIFVDAALGAVGGLAAAILAIGILPFLEQAFRITTAEKLIALARPNHPLLQRLLLEAPGTYYHSVLVGNLAETAADKVGADPVVARVGAYYHDVGKIQRPYFFIENQVNIDNPHLKLSPSLSTMIVTSHIRDGLEFCKEYKLPEIISDIIAQHHGTSLVSYFYKQATESGHSECIIEEDFRYEGPKPQTKEAALIMLADGCEAAVRSITKPNMSRIENTVRRVVQERLRDGQLNECDLTLKDLTIIGDVFMRVLCSTCHSRIEYPMDTVRELERRRPRNGNGNKHAAGKPGAAGSIAGASAENDGSGSGVAGTRA